MDGFKIKIEGIAPYDGEYDLDISKLTNRDYHTIKRLSGYTAPEFAEAFRRVDMAFFMALGVVAARRSDKFGQMIVEDAFWDATAGRVSIIGDEDRESVADPPTTPEAVTASTPSGESSNVASVIHQVRSLGSTGTDS